MRTKEIHTIKATIHIIYKIMKLLLFYYAMTNFE
jgi:hypothetical protein